MPKLYATPTRNDYRADIDGLRAVAISLVVIFHYFPSLIHGGFIGVDIFLVISGYLISKHILTDLDDRTFSYRTFYARRIKRIFPALSLILLFCIIAGWIVLTPEEYELLGKHIAAGAGFVANFTLWMESGYFDTAADTKPLLHLWSLGVEVQFYIIWPLLLAFFCRNSKHLAWCLLGAFSVAFICSMIIVQYSVIADFYSPLTRFWEFVVGASLAFALVHKANFTIDKRSFFSWIGLCLIVIAVIILNKDSHFPGAYALLPVLGAACLIFAGEKAWLNQHILANRFMVWIGLISYPLYLWHWPLLSFARVMDGQTPSVATRLCLIAVSILLAAFTYRFIERPIRFRKSSPYTVTLLCMVMTLILLAGLFIRNASGFTSRHLTMLNANPNTLILGENRNKLTHDCGLTPVQQAAFQWCLNDPRQSAHYAAIGDSKAEALYYGLVQESQATKGGWLLIGSVFPAERDTKKQAQYQLALQTIANNPNIQVVILVVAMRNIFPRNLDTGFIDTDVKPLTPAKIAAYSKTIQYLQHASKKVVFYIDNPSFPDPRSCISGGLTESAWLNKFLHRNKNPHCSISYTENMLGTAPYREFVVDLQKANPGLIVYDPTALLCDVPHNTCTITKAGNFLYSYDDHISDYANSMIAKNMLPMIYKLAGN